jgi:elongation factor Ts
MTKIQLVQQLRDLTQAGLSACKEAIEACANDLQAAVDYIKAKGLNIADAKASRTAAEGILALITPDPQTAALVEINCETDFTVKSPSFDMFVSTVVSQMALDVKHNHGLFQHDSKLIEANRKELVATTKENIVVSRWWVEQAMATNARVFSYIHSNNKIGVLLTMTVDNTQTLLSPEFAALGESLAMQVAAMSPLAVSIDKLNTDEIARQTAIFDQQLQGLNKPAAALLPIMAGKMNKWYQQVCLLEQDAVWLNKKTVKQAIEEMSSNIKIVDFIRAQVGENVAPTMKSADDFANEVAELAGK